MFLGSIYESFCSYFLSQVSITWVQLTGKIRLSLENKPIMKWAASLIMKWAASLQLTGTENAVGSMNLIPLFAVFF